jgi:hypothetical protein
MGPFTIEQQPAANMSRAVMPAVDDIHNQAVLRLVREEGAMHRTIGVITKCDMLQTHDEPKVSPSVC